MSEPKNTWREQPLLSIALSTTGLSPEADGIVHAAAVLMRGGQVVRLGESLANPGMPSTEGALAVHGLGEELLVDAPAPAEAVARAVEDALEGEVPALVCSYSWSRFTLPFLRQLDSEQVRATFSGIPQVDVLGVLKALRDAGTVRFRSLALGDACSLFGVRFGEGRDAEVKAAAVGALLWRLSGATPKILAALPTTAKGLSAMSLGMPAAQARRTFQDAVPDVYDLAMEGRAE